MGHENGGWMNEDQGGLDNCPNLPGLPQSASDLLSDAASMSEAPALSLAPQFGLYSPILFDGCDKPEWAKTAALEVLEAKP